jgi:hypothetical protein
MTLSLFKNNSGTQLTACAVVQPSKEDPQHPTGTRQLQGLVTERPTRCSSTVGVGVAPGPGLDDDRDDTFSTKCLPAMSASRTTA